jgi:hypothetical protein
VHTAAVGGVHVPEWHPWPGEQVVLDITRPDGVAGQSLTIDKASYEVRPGLRATDATLTLTVRASRGLQHTITLPEGATLEAGILNGAAQPIRQDGRKVTVPITPGVQTVRLAWRQPLAVGLFFRAPDVDLGASAVNVTTTITGQSDRWILLLGGPRVGPVVLFWSMLLVLVVVAAALARVRWTPIKAWQWALLAVGLSQVPAAAGAIVVTWLIALGWRKEKVVIRGGPIAFDLRQIALVVWTIVALVILVVAVQQGLLGAPDMQIEGNGASSGALAWYTDRSASTLASPWVISAPILVYRAAMLLWALWVALAVLKWLRWGWQAFTTGGAWKALPKPPPPKPPAPPPAAPPQDQAAPATAPS